MHTQNSNSFPIDTQNLPTISSSALRVGLSISVPTMRKMDKKATREVVAHNHAQTGSATVSKKLISNTSLVDMNKLVTSMRGYHRDQTVPWGDLGDRLVSNVNLIDYRNNMAQLEGEFWDLSQRILDDYPRAVAKAQLQLGDMFNEAEYPSVEQLRRKFKFSLAFEAVPDVGDFRVDIGVQAANEMREQYKQVLADRIDAVHQDLADRLAEPLQRMSKGLDYSEYERPSGFRETLVGNVLAIVDLMRSCNLNGNAHITAIQEDLRDTLKGVTPDGLRSDPHLRADTKRKVDQIIKNLPSLGF